MSTIVWNVLSWVVGALFSYLGSRTITKRSMLNSDINSLLDQLDTVADSFDNLHSMIKFQRDMSINSKNAKSRILASLAQIKRQIHRFSRGYDAVSHLFSRDTNEAYRSYMDQLKQRVKDMQEIQADSDPSKSKIKISATKTKKDRLYKELKNEKRKF